MAQVGMFLSVFYYLNNKDSGIALHHGNAYTIHGYITLFHHVLQYLRRCLELHQEGITLLLY